MVLLGEVLLACGEDSLAPVIRIHVMLSQVYVPRAKKTTQISASSDSVKIKSKLPCSKATRSTDFLRNYQGT
jgi:hypothetical protein